MAAVLYVVGTPIGNLDDITVRAADTLRRADRIVAEDPLTLQELGDRFGISRERVRQLEARLTGRLREFLKSELGDAVAS